MGKEHVCVVTVLSKNKNEDELTIENAYQYYTGIDDPKDIILFKKLINKHNRYINVDYELWKGEKYGGRLRFDTSKQIGESYAAIYHDDCGDEIEVFELYE